MTRFFSMKTRVLLALFLLMILLGCSEQVPNWLIGTWKSNEELTLRSVANTPAITDEAKKILSENFFGRLVNIYRKDGVVAYFIDEKPKTLDFVKYNKVSVNGNSVTFTYYEEMVKSEMSTTLYHEGECYYTLVSRWQFREYFCPYQE